MTTGVRGIRSSISSRRNRSARLRLRRRIRTSFMSASGEGLHRPDLSVGDGIYKSTDAGKTWTHLGLRDGQQIPALAVDPRDPNKLFAAVLGHPYGPNAGARNLSLDGWRSELAEGHLRRTRTPAGRMWKLIRRIRMSSTPRCGKRARDRGKTATSTTAPAAGCSSRPTAAARGSN